jgi:hypothetical protein
MRDLETINAELRLVSRAWRAARHMSSCTPITAHIDALLDERFVNRAARGLSELCRSRWHCAVIAQSGPRFIFRHPAELNHSCGADQHSGGRPSHSGQQIAHSDRQAPIKTEKVRGYGSGVLRYENQQNDQDHQPDDERPPRRRQPRQR